MKIKIFSGVNAHEIEKEVNTFFEQHGNVVPIQQSAIPTYNQEFGTTDTTILLTVLYGE